MSQINFDATAVPQATDMEALPAGTYTVQIVESEMRKNSNGSGEHLYLELEVLDGQHQGRKLFDRLNLMHSNQKAMDIAQRTLSSICHATGVLQVQDSVQLHNRPMSAKVVVTDDGKYNDIKAYKAAGNGAAQRPPQQAQPAAATAPPWATAS